MALDQVSATLLGTAVIVSIRVLFSNSPVSDIKSRLRNTNGRIDEMQHNLTALIRAENAKLQARLRHVEEKLGLR